MTPIYPRWDSSFAFMLLIFFLCFLVPAVLFLLAQQNTLKAIRPGNRELRPGLVWLQLIPYFNLYWQFVVVTRIADSISKETASFNDDSILGIADSDALESIGNRPTYKIGMAWCILFIIDVMGVYWKSHSFYYRQVSIVQSVTALSMITCWIIYWVKLADQKRKIKQSALAAGIR